MRRRVAVCFGGPSVEHDVSIISAQQLMAALSERHDPVPVYLARDGRWWTGEALLDVGAFGGDGPPRGADACELRLGGRDAAFVVPASSRFKGEQGVPVDVVICAIHGTGGEDGSLLGALEHTGLPYVGGGVSAAAVAMDKALAKLAFRDAGVEVNPHVLLTRDEWSADAAAALGRAADAFLPCYAKPATLGSSIGVTRATTRDELEEALELCFELDRKALVEPALDSAIEINAAVLGRPGGELRVSVLEQPVKQETGLSFEDKYLRGGKGKDGPAAGAKGEGGGDGMASQDRIIPAPIAESLAASIRTAAERAHRALGFAGVVRYDFLVEDHDGRTPRVVLNEANTVPGSFAFYLFEPAGLPFPDLGDALIDIAVAEAAEARSTTRTFESMLLARHQGARS
jgi:D-alanine-D-alanine ligase